MDMLRHLKMNVYTNFRGPNVAEDDTGCESFTAIYIDFLLVYQTNIWKYI